MPKNDIEKVKSIIKKSGNAFHGKVLKYLKEKDWTVLVSPYYNDNVSNKPREVDLIADNAFIAANGLNQPIGTINVNLFIECKYIPQKTVFWFHDKDKQKAEDLVLATTPLPKNHPNTQKHHYLGDIDHVAKLFAGEKQRSLENEIFYKALNQSLNAMIYYRGRESIISEQRNHVIITVSYPVIICNSFENLYRVDIESNDDPVKITENFQLEVNYAYLDSNKDPKNEYFFIDILSFDFLDNFLDTIKEDKNLIDYFIER